MSPEESHPTHPKALGEELRQLREAAGVSLDEIIEETKVSRRILEALENGRYQYLPESVFSRNFVRQYARFIQHDETALVEAFEAAWEHFRLASGSHPVVVAIDPPPPRPIRWEYWIPVIIAIAILGAALMMVFLGSEPSSDLELGRNRTAKKLLTPTGFPQAMQVSPTPFELAAAQVAQTADESPEAGTEVVRIQVEDDRECWIHYRDHNGMTGQQLLRGGEEVSLELKTPAFLSLGNASAVRIHVGDQVYTELGRPGQVIHCEVGEDGLVEVGGPRTHE